MQKQSASCGAIATGARTHGRDIQALIQVDAPRTPTGSYRAGQEASGSIRSARAHQISVTGLRWLVEGARSAAPS